MATIHVNVYLLEPGRGPFCQANGAGLAGCRKTSLNLLLLVLNKFPSPHSI